MWSVYDGIMTPGPTLKLVGPKSYNQVTRHLATKVFRGLQVCCSVRTLAQFDEPSPPKVQSVVLVPPQHEIARKTEAMDTASPKAEEGAVGGELCMDPHKYPMAWMRDRQRWYDDEQIEFWPLLHLLTDGKPGAGSPHKYTPEAEARKTPPMAEARKTPPTEQVEDVPVDEQEPAHIIAEEDDMVELHTETEDL